MTITINGITVEGTLDECKAFAEAMGKCKNNKGDKAPTPKREYVKGNGEKIMATDKQIALWESKKSAYTPEERAEYKEQKRAEWEKAHSEFKASDALKSFIKANPLCTRKEAKAQGFIGTKEELKALKASLK